MRYRDASTAGLKGVYVVSALILCCVVVLTGCRQGRTVDTGSPSFVDKNSAHGFDNQSPQPQVGIQNTTPSQSAVYNNTSKEYVLPPNAGSNLINNTTVISPAAEAANVFKGKDTVSLWVWNKRGSQYITLAAGSTLSLAKLGVSISCVAIGRNNGGKVKLAVNTNAAPSLSIGQETSVDGTWLLIDDVLFSS